MQLLIEAKPAQEEPAFVYAGLLIRTTSGKEANLKRLRKGDHLYLYITDSGDIGHTCGVFKSATSTETLTDPTSIEKNSAYSFTVEPAYTKLGEDDQKQTHVETMHLKGSRLQPTYLEVKRYIVMDHEDKGRTFPYAYVTGKLVSVHDKRRDYLSPDEETHWGQGLFSADNVKGIYDGCYVNLTMSPWATEISSMVEVQKRAYENYSESLLNPKATPAERESYKRSFETTQKLLRPHANEIYGYRDEQELLIINGMGCWQSEYLPGLRGLDEYDIARIHKLLVKEKYTKDDLRSRRESLGTESINEKFYLDTLAPALEPFVMKEADAARKVIEDRQSKHKNLSPKIGPLGSRDMPGLRDGTELFPHQSLILAALKDRDRMLVDADPGAGKTLVIICDILQQMRKGKIKKPLVLMPESLLSQFAHEVRNFSELNPWIINTQSIKNWDLRTKEEIEEEGGTIDDAADRFFEDSISAPPNTVFLTSYNWASREFSRRATGEMSKKGGYLTSKVYHRPLRLIEELGVDALYVDECHILKNASGFSWAATILSEVPIVRGFTGTVMPNNPSDVTGPMGAIHSSVFGTENDFLRDYTEGMSIYNYKREAPKAIRKRLQDFGVVSVRRSAWQHLLPKVIKQYHYATLTETQQKAYDGLLRNILKNIRNDAKLSKLLTRFEDIINAHLGEEMSIGPLLARFAPLDKFINAPAKTKVKTFVDDEEEGNKMFTHLMVGEDARSPKGKIINGIIRKHLAMPNHGKILVFVQYKDAAHNLLDNLDEDLKVHADYYDASLVDVLSRFKNPKDSLQILFAVDASVVLGHNIQSANCIIHADHKWIAGDMEQRESRSIRIKQQRDVYVHHVLANHTAEMLKMARIISAEHLIAKSNSDFDDDTMLQPIQMTFKDMKAFRTEEQLEPFIETRHEIEKKVLEVGKKERDFYGNSLLKPAGYSSIKETFPHAQTAIRLPTTKTFKQIGGVVDPKDRTLDLPLKDADKIKEKELEALPEEPSHLTLLPLGFYQLNSDWYLYAFKAVDPQGYLRRFRFNLTLPYYYYTLNNKGEVATVLNRLAKAGVTVSNQEQFNRDMEQERVYRAGTHQGLVRLLQKAKRKRVTGKTYTLSIDEVELQYVVMDGVPMLFVEEVFSKESTEAKGLKASGFEYGPSLWRRQVTRSILVKILKDFIARSPQLKIADWDAFKIEAHRIFKGLNLVDFDEVGET